MDTPQGPSERATKLLIVDDDPEIGSQLRLALRKDYEVHVASDPDAAMEIVQSQRPDLITLDLALDGVNPETGFSVLEKCLQFDPFVKIVLITGNDQEHHALRAIDQGAADFLGKPVDIEDLRVLLRQYAAKARLERRNAELLKQLGEERRLGALVGQSPTMKSVFKRIEKVARVDVEVLILGGSGTGKELVAREIRRLSSRVTKPFVTIDCGAIPSNLIESELFGHVKGTFTDAHESRPGRLELADGGIVFFDEIGELPLLLQVKLLRFLQEHEIERVGGREVIKLDVRVIAATSRNLEDEIKAGRFRQDLYYRLAVVGIKLPPLCERGEDILLLAEYFLNRYGTEYNRGRLSFTAKARRALQQQQWVGNVRDLQTAIKRGVTMSSGRQVDVDHLELSEQPVAKPMLLRDARYESERQAILEALRLTGGNLSRAAVMLGIARPSLYERLAKLDIDPREFRVKASRDRE
jgi:two-component system, NtrC family, response regulator